MVAISTINVAGNTHGRIVDERYRRDLGDGFLSYYDETKYLAHRAVLERIGSGARIVIAQPGTTYGPNDHSAIGAQLKGAYEGTLRYIAIGDFGISPVYVDDVAAGIVAALDRGRMGESYFLGGQNMKLRDAMQVAARLGGRRVASPGDPYRVRPVRLEGARQPRSGAGLPGRPRRGRAFVDRRHLLGFLGQPRRNWATCRATSRAGCARRSMGSDRRGLVGLIAVTLAVAGCVGELARLRDTGEHARVVDPDVRRGRCARLAHGKFVRVPLL